MISKHGYATCALIMLLAGCATGNSRGLTSAAGQPLRDHHSHVQSQLVIDAMSRGCRAQPQICPPKLPPPRTGADMLRELDEAGIGQSVVVSTAYLLGVPLTAGEGLDQEELVRAENLFAAKQAALNPNRLLLAVGVPVMHPSAEAELAYWLPKPQVAAVKVHLTASGFSFRNPDHVARLKWLFASAARAGKPVLIHMRTPEPDYGAQDVEIFVREVVPAASGQPIQIAHAGGWGGFDRRTGDIVDAFAKFAANGALPPNVFFDISGIAFPQVPAERLQAAADKLRQVGVSRLVFGSDSGMDMTPAKAWQLMRDDFGFTPDEWDVIRRNRLPLQTRR